MLGRNYPALAISLAMHGLLLGVLAAFRMAAVDQSAAVVVETVFNEDRVQEQFSQDVEIDTTVSETLAVTAGGMVSDVIGAAAATPIAQSRVEQSQIVDNPEVRVPDIGDIDVATFGELDVDLGVGEISGEVGARVEGYGAAMHALTREIIRMLRQQPVICVWLFDASNSQKDDREEIAENFNKIYEELDIAREQADLRNKPYEALETVVCKFGERVQRLTPQPTADLDEIRAAIAKVDEEESGLENVFAAVDNAIEEYGPASGRTRRKLAVIVVTDESGDDEKENLEGAVEKAKQYRVPVYFLGREAIFGYEFARVRWVDPETNLVYYPRISRGPETAFPECLQYQGFHDRSWEAASSGFGPYGQVRLAKESGGIYFLLARDEVNLVGWGANQQRKFEDVAMKEYEPVLTSRREYVALRETSDFRKTIWDVIVTLDPDRDKELNLAMDGYPLDNKEFRTRGQEQFERTLRAMQILKEAVQRLDRVRPDRASEASQRWRAAYDLMYAQCLAYRVRQFQLLLAIDRHGKEDPKPKDPKSNHWDVRRVPEMLEPNEQQVKATKVDMAELESERQNAIKWYQVVIDEHPDTPWALRARQEMAWGFGITFVEDYYDPRYNDPRYRDRAPKF